MSNAIKPQSFLCGVCSYFFFLFCETRKRVLRFWKDIRLPKARTVDVGHVQLLSRVFLRVQSLDSKKKKFNVRFYKYCSKIGNLKPFGKRYLEWMRRVDIKLIENK